MPAKMQDVARRAGVSTATVSRVLNSPELVSADAYRRVMDAIRDLDYKVNLAARRLRTNQTHTIAIVIPTISEPVIHEIVEAVEDVAITHQYTLLVCSTRGDTAREEAYIQLLTQQTLVDGVLYVSPRSAPEQVLKLAHGNAPLVLCNYTIDGLNTPSVLVDHVRSIYQATRYLLELGHHRIALLNLAAPHYYPARMRRKGFEKAYVDAGLMPDPALIVELVQPTYAHDDWRDAITGLLDQPDRPTAIVAFNDNVALEVYAACRARGLRIPDDLSVTGCDNILSSRYVDPPLTTVRVPSADAGRLAMRYLIRLITDENAVIPPITLFDVDLIVRESCAPPP
ncbi:MAG: LacI family DNA-binding transcriptional regulator [Anaerolineae bacterium]|nr:LacI family DNA-binding transcriptional regulator [Anaerolineae bacterium]